MQHTHTLFILVFFWLLFIFFCWFYELRTYEVCASFIFHVFVVVVFFIVFRSMQICITIAVSTQIFGHHNNYIVFNAFAVTKKGKIKDTTSEIKANFIAFFFQPPKFDGFFLKLFAIGMGLSLCKYELNLLLLFMIICGIVVISLPFPTLML